MTHWKKVVSDPKYIGEADFEEGEEKILTIGQIVQEKVTSERGSEMKTVIHWQEADVKALILNVTNSKAISKVAGSPYLEKWPGVQVQLHIEAVQAFGESVNAVRVSPRRPRPQQPVSLCSACKKPIRAAFNKSATGVAEYTRKKYGVALCADCAAKRKQATQNAPPETDGLESTAKQEQAPEMSVSGVAAGRTG